MEFIKLVQQKDQKSDNLIIVGTVLLVILIMSAIVFWPNGPKHRLLAYLPESASFYIHWMSEDYFYKGFLAENELTQEIADLKNILQGDFLNLQEILWFQTDNNLANNNYLLRFSRLPRSSIEKLQQRYPEINIFSPQKNILLINDGTKIENLEVSDKGINYFDDGISFYWTKGKSPQFLGDIAALVEPAFSSESILVNWQKSQSKNQFSLLENKAVKNYDIKYFLTPRHFDIALGFNSVLSPDWSNKLSNGLLQNIIDSLPYYNLNQDAIERRILTDSMIWQKDDAWILASYKDFNVDILDFIRNFKVGEQNKVLSDGTAYVELVAADDQTIVEHQIGDQKVIQIDQVFSLNIGQQHYLGNKLELLAELIVEKYSLLDFFQFCGAWPDSNIGDFVYLKTDNLSAGQLKEYLLSNNINYFQAFSYSTGTISGLNICF